MIASLAGDVTPLALACYNSLINYNVVEVVTKGIQICLFAEDQGWADSPHCCGLVSFHLISLMTGSDH